MLQHKARQCPSQLYSYTLHDLTSTVQPSPV